MLDDKDIILEILSKILGEPEKSYDSKLQYGYNCPQCGVGQKKGNLEISLEKHLYHCWSCGEINDMHGPLGKLIDIYGTKNQKKVYNLLRPEEQKVKEKKPTKLKLPKEFVSFKDINPLHIPHKEALKYIRSRGITDQMIEKYNIGFACEGEYMGRVIVPSYDVEGELNYFVSRAWFKTKNKYKNPEAPKELIIFNEKLIDWTKPIYICEGVFDGFFTPNPVILLGKVLHDLLFEKIYNNAQSDVIICLDEDAWNNAKKLYNTLNGGKLRGRVKIIKLPKDKDVAELRGNIEDYFYQMNY
jgi:DNA primase